MSDFGTETETIEQVKASGCACGTPEAPCADPLHAPQEGERAVSALDLAPPILAPEVKPPCGCGTEDEPCTDPVHNS